MSNMDKDPAEGLNAALAATLNAERVAAGMTIDELAEATHISKRTLVRKLSKTERHLDIAEAAVIAEQFGLSLAEALRMAEERHARRTARKDEKGTQSA